MKLALISDIHGNSLALEAVLADIAAQGGASEVWVLGDLAALGPDPVGVLKRLAELPQARFVRGNTDRYLVSGERPPPSPAQAAEDPRLLPKVIEIASSFAWTLGALAATGWLGWLRALPLEIETQLPDGTRLLGVHASPGRDDGPGFAPDDTDAEMLELLQDCQANLVCTGHTHHPVDRRVGRWRVVNLGSVSNPLSPDRRASYALLHALEAGYRVEHRRVEYDYQAVVEMLVERDHPAAASLRQYYAR
jgi:predicted phosphodiesterase